MNNYFEDRYSQKKQNNESGWNTDKLIDDVYLKVTNVLNRNKVQKGRLLELGCGDGKLSVILARSGFELYGVDISSTAIEWANQRNVKEGTTASFEVGNVLDLNFNDNTFDIALDSFCFHCITENRETFLSESFRVLKKGGILIIMSKCGTPKDPDYPFDPVTRCKIENGAATRYWGEPNDIVNEVKRSGFTVIDYQVFSYDQDLIVINAKK
ncbi:MAG: methyltransferase domain-containing protein [Clostridia bacterium]|nr:methyltransferase domain-containing protein [Clostridia bacterium]